MMSINPHTATLPNPASLETLDIPAGNMIAMQAQIAAKTRRSLAPLLGAPEFVTETRPKPTNEEAYKLVLEARSIPGETDPKLNRRATEMLKRAVQLDPAYAQAWEDLSARCLADVWVWNGGQAALDGWWDAGERAAQLDPDNVIFRAAVLYMQGSIGKRAQRRGISRGEAYRRLEELIRLRPDSARLHFDASWMLRDAGLLEESARECETSMLIDAQDAGPGAVESRSCCWAIIGAPWIICAWIPTTTRLRRRFRSMYCCTKEKEETPEDLAGSHTAMGRLWGAAGVLATSPLREDREARARRSA